MLLKPPDCAYAIGERFRLVTLARTPSPRTLAVPAIFSSSVDIRMAPVGDDDIGEIWRQMGHSEAALEARREGFVCMQEG